MEIPWKEEYSVKVKEIDDQHKNLFLILNNLYNSIKEGNSEKIIQEIINELIKYSQEHFSTEERYFKKFNYEKTEEHIKEHERFKKELAELTKNLKFDEDNLEVKILDFLEDWLVTHVTEMDQEYVNCFIEHGLK